MQEHASAITPLLLLANDGKGKIDDCKRQPKFLDSTFQEMLQAFLLVQKPDFIERNKSAVDLMKAVYKRGEKSSLLIIF
jgi:hypothetical protein